MDTVYGNQRGGKTAQAMLSAVESALRTGKPVLLITGSGSLRIEPTEHGNEGVEHIVATGEAMKPADEILCACGHDRDCMCDCKAFSLPLECLECERRNGPVYPVGADHAGWICQDCMTHLDE